MKYLIKESQLNVLSEETKDGEFVKNFLEKRFPDEIFKVVISKPYETSAHHNGEFILVDKRDIIVVIDSKDLMNMTSMQDTGKFAKRKIDKVDIARRIVKELRLIGIKPYEFASPWELKILEMNFV